MLVKSKAEAAAQFISKRVPSVSVTPHFCKIQELDDEFYIQFDIVFGGLDSLPARLWLNGKLVELAQLRNKVIPYIDGGSLAWTGNLRFILPTETACLKCIESQVKEPEDSFHMCTLASRPRIPAHLVHWAMEIAWKDERKNEQLDGDNDENIQYITKKANEHADRFNLDHVDERFARSVVKNTVPAIASTQSIVASTCVIEGIKLLSGSAPNIPFHLLINGQKRIYLSAIEQERLKDCGSCAQVYHRIKKIEGETVQQFQNRLAQEFGNGYLRASISIEKTRVFCFFSENNSLKSGKTNQRFCANSI